MKIEGGALQLGKWWDIPVKLHWTFPLLILYVAYIGWDSGLASWAIIGLVGFQLCVFGCVVLHEYGHALAARRYGVHTKDIILTPIGGIARLLKIPEKPIQEIVVAVAGPAVNAAIMILCVFGILLLNTSFSLDLENPDTFSSLINFPTLLLWVNGFLLAFNMIPAFPMDGGRVLRALLAMKLNRAKATQIAGIIGQVLSAAFLIFGIYYGHWSLTLIGVFIFVSARQEIIHAKKSQKLRGTQVSQIMNTEFLTFGPQDPMMLPIAQLSTQTVKDFLVVNEHKNVVGVLHEEYIREAQRLNEIYSSVLNYMQPNYMLLSPMLNIEKALKLFQTNPYSVLPVVVDDQIIGTLDRRILQDFVNRA